MRCRCTPNNAWRPPTFTENEPKIVRLKKDFQDPKISDVHFKAGTVLIRGGMGAQYMPDGTELGMPCVRDYALIRDICEVLE